MRSIPYQFPRFSDRIGASSGACLAEDVGDDFVEILARRQVLELPYGGGGGDRANRRAGILDAEPGGQHAAVRAAEQDDGPFGGRVLRVLGLEVVDDEDEVGERLTGR